MSSEKTWTCRMLGRPLEKDTVKVEADMNAEMAACCFVFEHVKLEEGKTNVVFVEVEEEGGWKIVRVTVDSVFGPVLKAETQSMTRQQAWKELARKGAFA